MDFTYDIVVVNMRAVCKVLSKCLQIQLKAVSYALK
jgi:hypothetical protein